MTSSVISDHYQPWLSAQGHSGYAWSILGAATQATERIPLITYVTRPIRRYHPAIGAQKAPTMQILSDGRFRLGLEAGENLNEHVVGKGWPAVGRRHEMRPKAVDIIAAMFDRDGSVNYHGKYFDIESALLWDRPDARVRSATTPIATPPCSAQTGSSAGSGWARRSTRTCRDRRRWRPPRTS